MTVNTDLLQAIINDMLDELTQVITMENMLTPDDITFLCNKGYTVSEEDDNITISTDYNPELLNISHANQTSDNLNCHVIPNAGRIRTEIIRRHLNGMETIYTQLNEGINSDAKAVRIEKEDVSDADVFAAIVDDYAGGSIREFKQHYRVTL